LENVLSYVPQTQQEAVQPELKAIFYQDSREEADQAVAAFCEKYGAVYPTAVACLRSASGLQCLPNAQAVLYTR